MSKILFLMVVILSLIMMALKVSYIVFCNIFHFLDFFSYFYFVKGIFTDNTCETKMTLKINMQLFLN